MAYGSSPSVVPGEKNKYKKKKPKEYSEKIQKALKTIIDEFENEDQSVRERQIRVWKRLQLMWSGFTRIYWSETAHDWRIADNFNNTLDDQSYYDKNINIFKAYLESIIAAMSATVPGVKCKPDDADNINDVLTAKGGTKIAELIYQHNDAPLLWIKALFIYCTQGMIAAWNYTDEDEKYGFVQIPNEVEAQETVTEPTCPNCGMPLEGMQLEQAIKEEWAEMDEFDPEMPSTQSEMNGTVLCEACEQQVMPQMQERTFTVTRIDGVTERPKSRQKIIVEGGLYIKVPNYARCQEDCPYLAYCYETHYTNIYKEYPHLRQYDADLRSNAGGSSSGNNLYERWGRLSPQYYGEYPKDTPTVRNWWLRPSSFEVIADEDTRRELYKHFPNGAMCVFVNDNYAEARDQSLDDCWTLTYNPLSEYIHFDPLGLMITSIQEITSDLISLTLQTVEHGIPQTFADPQVLNFDQYRQMEVTPGGIFPAKPKNGRSIGDGFYEVKTATLSGEIMPFAEKVQELGQFLSGAMPSVFGGDQSNSSRTASQYAMSRSQALQRLQTPWKMLTFWWKSIFGKVIPAYIKTMLDDEKLVKEQGDNWINIVIKKAEMDGRLGDVELEAADDLPMTTSQVKDIIMNLMQINNPEILQALGSPRNLPLIAQAIGLNDFHVPGEDDREKQFEEIQLLIKAEPIVVPNMMTGQEDEQTTIQPELFVDDHGIESDICRSWLVGEAGRQCKINNEKGYRNVLLHLQAHMMMTQQLQQMFAPPPMENAPQGNPNSEKPKKATVMGRTTKEESGNNGSARVQ